MHSVLFRAFRGELPTNNLNYPPPPKITANEFLFSIHVVYTPSSVLVIVPTPNEQFYIDRTLTMLIQLLHVN